jgi:hypothetical protein
MAKEIKENGQELTLQKAWAMLQEIAEWQKETDRQIKEINERLTREIEERQKKPARRQYEDDVEFEEIDDGECDDYPLENFEYLEDDEEIRLLKKRERRQEKSEWGRKVKTLEERRNQKLLEELCYHLNDVYKKEIEPKLWGIFKKIGIDFRISFKDWSISDYKNNFHAYSNTCFESEDFQMAVRVWAKPTAKDINKHVENMRTYRAYADLRGYENYKRHTYRGAVVGIEFDKDVKALALKEGFYAIEDTGDKLVITVPEGEYSVKEW